MDPIRDHSSIRRARLHEQRLGRRPDRGLDRRLAGHALLEPEVALGPAQQLEHRLLDLRLELAVELAPRDGAEADQDVAEPAAVPAALERRARDGAVPR